MHYMVCLIRLVMVLWGINSLSIRRYSLNTMVVWFTRVLVDVFYGCGFRMEIIETIDHVELYCCHDERFCLVELENSTVK